MTTHPPITVPAAIAYADQAERLIDDGAPKHASLDARAITAALLYVGAAIEAASARHADDADALAAMLDERLSSVIEVIDPAFVARPPLWRRALGRLRGQDR